MTTGESRIYDRSTIYVRYKYNVHTIVIEIVIEVAIERQLGTACYQRLPIILQ